jgi:PDZ domain-containing protein
MTDIDTLPPSLPPASEPAPRRAITPLWFAVGAVITVVIAVGIAVAVIPVKYVIISPGQTYRATQLVELPSSVATFPPKGEIRFVTVSERVEPSLLEKIQAEHDSDDDVLTEKQVFGDQTRQESTATNQIAMTDSKDTAAMVALRKLGYPVASDVVVVGLVDGAPAAAVAKANDVIVSIDGTPVTSTDSLRAVLKTHQPGDTVTVEVADPSGQHTSGPVVLGTNPDTGVAYLGVSLADRPRADSLPFPVTIDTSRVGGPSAGLAFALAILDVLTPGDITGGQVVAVTGTINADGSVGAIGGIEQKVVTVEQAGVKVFLVPADDHCGDPSGSCNYTDAKRKAGTKVQVIPVANLDDALHALAALGGNALSLR